MTVLDRRYRRWTGQPLPHWRRVLVLPRQALSEVFERKLTLVVFVGCFVPPLVLAACVYVSANLDLVAKLVQVRTLGQLSLTPAWFEGFTTLQCWLAVVLTLLVGPRPLVRDTVENALPLYFSKSLTRVDYALGRWSSVALLVSAVTWVPLLLVFGLQLALAPPEWRASHAWVGGSVLVTGLALTLLLTTLVTAVAGHLRRLVLAQAVFLGLVAVTQAFASTLFALSGLPAAHLLSPMAALLDLRAWAFAPPGAAPDAELGPAWCAVAILAWTGGAAALLLRRLRPVEVVR